MNTTNFSTSKRVMLEEIKALHNQDEFSDCDAERWNSLCESLDNGDFRELLLNALDDDQELTLQMQECLKATGTSIQELAFGGIAIGAYILDTLYPYDSGWDRFGEFWLDACWGNESIGQTIHNAINKALDKMISEELSA